MLVDRRTFSIGAAATALAACANTPVLQRPPTSFRLLPTETSTLKQDDIFFINTDVGWYGNGDGKLFHTRDGGESWTKIWENSGTFIRALGFLDADNGFLGNVGVGYRPTITDAQPLYRTRDGGLTWTPVEAEGIGAVRGVCAIDVLHQQQIFQGELQNATIVHAGGRVRGPAMLLRSLDGGESWRLIDLSEHAGMVLDVKFLDADNGFVCAASSGAVAEANALILRTTDGGATWREVYRSARLYETCWKISFASRRVAYATVQNYEQGTTERVVVKSVDGGATWRELPLVVDPEVREFGIAFVDGNWGFVGASTTGFETRDGGASWTRIDIGRAVNKIRIVRAPGLTRVFTIGLDVHRLDIV